MLLGPTLAEVKTAVQAYGYTTDTDTQQTQLVQLVQRRVLARRRWPFLETQTAALSTTAGTSAVSLTTADLLHVHAVRIAQGTTYPEIEAMNLQELRSRRHVDRVLACPDAWAQANGTVELYPIPDKVYSLAVDYATHPAAPVAGTDVLAIPKAYMGVIVWGVVEGLATRQRDWNAASNARVQFADQLREMTSAYNMVQRQNSTKVGSSDFWDDAAR